MQWNIGSLSWFCWAWKLASCDNFSMCWCGWWSYQDWSVAVVFVFHKHQPSRGQFWKIKCLLYTCANANWRPFLLNTLPAASSLFWSHASDWVGGVFVQSVITALSKKYHDLPCVINQTYHTHIADIPRISAVSYTAALLLLVDQAPALKMEFKLLEAWFRVIDCPNCWSGTSAQSSLLILSVLADFFQKRYFSPLPVHVGFSQQVFLSCRWCCMWQNKE